VVVALAPKHPEWKERQPFKAFLTRDREAMAKFTLQDIEKIVAVPHTGMTVAAAKHWRFKRPYTESMAEARQWGWVVISMKSDWKRIFAFE